AHAYRHVAIGAGQHGRDRIAGAGEVEAAGQAADCVLGQFHVREQPGQLDLAKRGLDPGVDGVATRIQPDVGADLAAGDAEVERVQAQQPGFQQQVRVHVVDGQVRRVDAARAQAYVRVHRAQL